MHGNLECSNDNDHIYLYNVATYVATYHYTHSHTSFSTWYDGGTSHDCIYNNDM